jgi:hypothetical protein
MADAPTHPVLLVPPSITEAIRYDVFISYRHREPDTTWANWLLRELEGYKPPGSVRASLAKEGRPVRIKRVYRDEDESSAGGDLSEALKEALRQSRNLVVICSRNTPGSRWIDDEIRYFSALGRSARIMPFLVEGEPDESFPIAIRAQEDGLELDAPPDAPDQFEPLAADVRPRKGLSAREIKRRGLLKVVAGTLDVRYDALYQRDLRRRRNRWIASGVAAGVLATGGAGWFAWTRTDTYQVQSAFATAPGLLLSAQGDDVYAWCRTLAVTGHFDEALRTARAVDTFGGDRVKALITVAEAAMELKRETDFEELMTEAAGASRGYKPAFAMQMRREVASAFLRHGRSDYARNFIKDSETASREVTNIGERVQGLRKYAELLLTLEGDNYASQVPQYDAAVFRTVAAMVGAEAAMKKDRRAEADRLTSLAIASSQQPGAKPHTAYLLAWTLETAASAGLTTLDPRLAQQALRLARQMPAGDAKSVAIRQAVTALSRLDAPGEASPMLEVILDDAERLTGSEAVARAFARKGDVTAALAILDVYQEDDLDRYSILSGIGEGLGDNYQPATLAALDAVLDPGDQLEVRVDAIQTLRKAGHVAVARELLANALQLARGASEDTDEVLSRLGEELLASGQEEHALALARQSSDPHTKTFSLIAVAKNRLSQKSEDGVSDLLVEAGSAEAQVPDDDLRAAGYREIGRVFRSMGRPEAVRYFQQAIAEATKGGKYSSDTVADVAEELVALGQLHDARTIADRYCEEGDRLRVYTALVLKYFGLPNRTLEFED